MSAETSPRCAAWKWMVCSLLLLATMLNYMDRQTLSQTITSIRKELGLDESHYGQLEMGFGLAFALGGITSGFLVDRLSVRWLYPLILIGWSLAGVATAYAGDIGASLASGLVPLLGPQTGWLGDDLDSGRAFLGLMVCRITLGFFEAGQWPCALVTIQRILSRQDRSLGNSLLQSGASLGAIFTPIVVLLMVTPEPGSWRGPFVVIGLIGLCWVLPWWSLIGAGDLARLESPQGSGVRDQGSGVRGLSPLVPCPSSLVPGPSPLVPPARDFWQRYLVLVVMVVTINLTWHFFRAWLPTFLEEHHGYDKKAVNYFTSAYYIATDIGCLGVGAAVGLLTRHGWEVHRARLVTFFFCTCLTTLSMLVPFLERGWLLLGVFLLIGAGALGLYPNFYALTQELSYKHQGKVIGTLSAITWIATSIFQGVIGQHIKATKSYTAPLVLAGLVPLLAFLAVWLFWKPPAVARPESAPRS